MGEPTPARPRIPLGPVLVRGSSMAPTLRDGDRLLVRWGARPRPGDVVVARLPDRPLGVKRARLREADGSWWLSSDNPLAGTDSATFGTVPAADVLARVVLRYRPRPALLRRAREDRI